MARCYGKFCNRRLKGFGDAKAATGPLVLAVKAVRERECGVALEALGRAKALLSASEKARPIVQKSIKFVETACPKSRFVPVRADVVEALRLAPGTELPSTWGKSVENLMKGKQDPWDWSRRQVWKKEKGAKNQGWWTKGKWVPRTSAKGGLHKPKARRIWDPKRRVYFWREPSKDEMDIWADLAYRHARPADTKHPESGSRSMLEKVRYKHRRGGEAVKRRRGRPRKRS